MDNKKKFDLFIFDLDGTLINTEDLHYQSYKETLIFFGYVSEFTFETHCKYCHYDDNMMKNFVNTELNVNYEKFYQHKKNIYLSKLSNNLQLINGVEELINKLYTDKIKMCIVSHSDKETINNVIEKLPIFKKINKILSRDDYLNRKPHPECYLKALELFPECTNPIGFEDSFKGWESLNATSITPVFVGSSNYFYHKKMNPVNSILDFTFLDESQIILKENNISKWIDTKLNIYENYINNLKESFQKPIQHIISILKNTNSNIYLTGIGKCGHICKKSVSTWQSMGISCHYLNLPDLFHGDFGILRDNDVIIYISNSGNTNEIINCASYIKEKFKVLQIGLTINPNNKLSSIVNFSYSISNPINEIDTINMAPTVSSVIFMMFLDMLGVYLSENNKITIEKFQLYHPGGDLGKKSKNIIDYVVIVASGSGTRLYPLTKYIPKILVTFKNKLFIEHLIEYWGKIAKNIIIIINSDYLELMKFYINDNIKIITFNELTGTADTINKTITNEYYNKNILFTWCDIIPEDEINLKELNNTTIFTYGNECRYKAENNKIWKKEDGNIIGMYYIQNYKGLKNYNLGEDICDVFIKNFGNFTTYNLEKLIDIGDMPKFMKYLTHNFQTRFFNKISYDNNIVIKEACNQQGYDIIKKEINWYNFVSTNNYSFLPIFNKIDDTSFRMNNLNAEPLYKSFSNFTLEERNICLEKIYKNLDLLHQNKCQINVISEENVKIKEDIKKECYDKIKERLNKIKPILDYFSNIKKINNIQINVTIDDILEKLQKILLNNYENYTLIHGDCQFSNTLYNGNIYFIDPRGYFGNTLLYGDKDYDYAKVLYALTGYDNFNNDSLFNVEIQEDNINYNIPNYLEDGLKYKCSGRIKAWLVIIWFGLAQYNSNNVIKCITSYYNGFYWFDKLFKNIDEI